MPDIQIKRLPYNLTAHAGLSLVGRTCMGFDGYAPIAGYRAEEGSCLGLELRPGTRHSACTNASMRNPPPHGRTRAPASARPGSSSPSPASTLEAK